MTTEMQKVLYREWFGLIDKTTWAVGKWDSEPDRVQWENMKSRYPCLIRRAYVSGSWCGYVGVLETHKLHGVDRNDVEDGVDVHGGLTFADYGFQTKLKPDGVNIEGDGDFEKLWWFGFDCGHYADVKPAIDALLRETSRQGLAHFPGDSYKTWKYVIAETNALAEQLKEFEKEG